MSSTILAGLPSGIRNVVGPVAPDTAKDVDAQLAHDARHRPDRLRADAAAGYARSETHFLAHAALASAPLENYPERIAWQAVGFYREALWFGASS
jgi:hypothetical protein